MKAYVMTTGVIFALLLVAHIMRLITESRALATDPFFVATTTLAAALCIWAGRLLWQSRSV